jgi:uncharacterized membrane protein YdjX (TVP38/TMEM64 family)
MYCRPMRSWIILSVLLLALILGPFLLFEARMNACVESLLAAQASKGAIAAGIASVLALDVFLPVPSSIVSTAAGALLGFAAGVAVSTAGMTAGCMLGYVCGQKFGVPLVRRMVRERDLEEVTARFRGGADWALATMRPVPVLAEASASIGAGCRRRRSAFRSLFRRHRARKRWNIDGVLCRWCKSA